MPGEIKITLRNINFNIRESNPVELFGNYPIPHNNIGNFVRAIFSEDCAPFFRANRVPLSGTTGVVRKKSTTPAITTNNSDGNVVDFFNKTVSGG